jgi:hypothetical protein
MFGARQALAAQRHCKARHLRAVASLDLGLFGLFRLDVFIAARSPWRRNDRHRSPLIWRLNRHTLINIAGRLYHAVLTLEFILIAFLGRRRGLGLDLLGYLRRRRALRRGSDRPAAAEHNCQGSGRHMLEGRSPSTFWAIASKSHGDLTPTIWHALLTAEAGGGSELVGERFV